MSDAVIRRARVEDAEALTDLHLDVWEEAYAGLIADDVLAARRAGRADRVERWRGILAASPDPTWLAESDGRLLGFSGAAAEGRDEPEPGLPRLELMALYVRAELYGAGLGHRLLQAAIGDAAAYLWVLDGNARAIAFYERQGFGFDGRTKTEPVGVERRMVRRSGGAGSTTASPPPAPPTP